jgi:micrococcal nuclease
MGIISLITVVIILTKNSPLKIPELSSTILTPERQNQTMSEIVSIVRVVDGDTIIVKMNGVDKKVRLMGLNTPETVDPRRLVQCFGKEASDKAKMTLSGQEVKIETDPTQDTHDKYGRLLAYVFLSDGTLFNKMMIEEGYGYEYTYQIPYKYQKEFKNAQIHARESKKGLWGAMCEK